MTLGKIILKYISHIQISAVKIKFIIPNKKIKHYTNHENSIIADKYLVLNKKTWCVMVCNCVKLQ